MPYVGDIREYKTRLRKRYRAERQRMSPADKAEIDHSIFERFLRLNQFTKSQILLTYVSTPLEIDTRELILYSLRIGKTVAVPRCIPGTRNMKFYKISSISELSPGSFGVLEPDENPENELKDFSGSICVVPGFCFDGRGYRLGYGKGYYDRFLSSYNGVKVGVSYASGVRTSLIHGRFDCAVDFVVTERYIRSTALNR